MPGRRDEAGGEDGGDEVVLFGIPQEQMTPEVRHALDTLLAQIEETREGLEAAKRRVRELEALADQDTLTPVFNRRAFLRELGRSMAFAKRHDSPLSLVFIDINRLKALNDRHGHAVGDEALRRVAEILVDGTRASDTVARLGGDEFAILLPKTEPGPAQELADRLSCTIGAERIRSGETDVMLSVSYGVHPVDPQHSPEAALAAADREMYAHKRGVATLDERAEPADSAELHDFRR